jgi:predicted nuclease of restriction endonuclease-like (RecB) superfamily
MPRKKKAPEQEQSPQVQTSQSDTIVQAPLAQLSDLPVGYAELLADLEKEIGLARLRASVSINREMTLLYWQTGRRILERQQHQGWGAKVIDRLAADLRGKFPDLQGFSPRNLKYMRTLAATYPDVTFVQEALAQISWYHNITLLEKVKGEAERHWYIRQTIEHGWSRAVMVHHIESGLYQRQGRALTNFERTLPPQQSDLAREVLKDPYSFDFLMLAADARERDLERGLLEHLRNFLIELGVGFAFVGSQYHLEVGGEDFYLDLLFYHLRLRCFVVIELKLDEFRPEHAGKMNFYLSAVDDLLRHTADQPTIGLILCKDRNRVIVEYALRDTSKPMGVAGYTVRTGALPEGLRESLPSIDSLEAELRARTDGGADGDAV